MRISGLFTQARSKTGAFLKWLYKSAAATAAKAMSLLPDVVKGLAGRIKALAKALAKSPVRQRSMAAIYKLQNLLLGWVVRLRVLFQSSRRYRSFVFMLMSAMALSLVLALLFFISPDPTDSQAADEADSGVEQLSPDDSEEFPSDIFSDETLSEEDAAPTSPEAAATDAPAPAPLPDIERSQVDREAWEEIKRSHENLNKEIDRLRKEIDKRQVQNEKNRELLDRYEEEIERLREQVREQEARANE